MIIELITVAALDISPDYDLNTSKAIYLQEIVSRAIDDHNYLLACEGQKLITRYMIQAGRPLSQRMIEESRELEQQLCAISKEKHDL